MLAQFENAQSMERMSNIFLDRLKAERHRLPQLDITPEPIKSVPKVPWEEHDDRILKALWKSDIPQTKIALAMGRSSGSVSSRISMLGLRKSQN